MAGRSRPTEVHAALLDLAAGFDLRWVWGSLALTDVKSRYRGSVLGPFWSTLSTSLMIGGLDAIFATTFAASFHAYLPYLAIGVVLWQFISLNVVDASTTFTAAEGMIQQTALPLSVHVYRVAARNFLIFAHTAVIAAIVVALYPPNPSWTMLTLLPAFGLYMLNSVWITLFLGMLSARYRDIPPITASFLQFAFFVTPIFWPNRISGALHKWVVLNPIYAAIDVVRAPLIGLEPAPTSWPIFVAASLLGSALALTMYSRCLSRIPFWL